MVPHLYYYIWFNLSSWAISERRLSFKIRRHPTHMVHCLCADSVEERSLPCVFLQPRTKRTSGRARGPR
jgi:hypothetical protein